MTLPTGTIPLAHSPLRPPNILMYFFYGARFARWDLLKFITKLATMITRWTTACDAALLRLARYVHGTVDWVLIGYVGDDSDQLCLR